jgi:hypothetical protein
MDGPAQMPITVCMFCGCAYLFLLCPLCHRATPESMQPDLMQLIASPSLMRRRCGVCRAEGHTRRSPRCPRFVTRTVRTRGRAK